MRKKTISHVLKKDFFVVSKVGSLEFIRFRKRKLQLQKERSYVDCRAFHAVSFDIFYFSNEVK